MAGGHQDVAGLLRKHGYLQLKKVGEGSFGKAILVEAQDKSRLICKMVDVSKASKKEMQDAVKEGKLLSELKHPYIVRYRENFTESGWLCILMDYAEGGDLTAQIEQAKKKRQPIAEDQVLRWYVQAILALKYIHDKHILHRDLKPSNFFLSKNGSMKMGDFGIAKVLACTIAVARTQIGTPYYLSPELCQEKPYTWPSDIWAMGCILYELCALKVPFDAPNIPGLVQKITGGQVPAVPNSYSEFVRKLCSEMLNRNPNARPNTDDILQRPRIQAIVTAMISEAQTKVDEVGNEGVAMPPPVRAATPSQQAQAAGPYESNAGGYKKDDLVEYLSSAHKDWLPARVTNVDGEGRIIIDLKPNTWITKAEQVGKIRPRKKAAADRPGSRGGPPSLHRSPSVGAAERNSIGSASPMHNQQRRPSSCGASPMMQRCPSRGGRPSQGASPMLQQSPRAREAPPSRGASPMIHRSPSAGAAGSNAPGWGVYRKGDLVEYHSSSHKDWLPATVTNVDGGGRIIIDLKPSTWISREEQAGKIRPRGGKSNAPPSTPSRGASPMVQRSPSRGGLERNATPSRAASPSSQRRSSSQQPPSRAESPRMRGAPVGYAGCGTPRQQRPPGLPPGIPRVSDSPLRQGGRNIAGM